MRLLASRNLSATLGGGAGASGAGGGEVDQLALDLVDAAGDCCRVQAVVFDFDCGTGGLVAVARCRPGRSLDRRVAVSVAHPRPRAVGQSSSGVTAAAEEIGDRGLQC